MIKGWLGGGKQDLECSSIGDSIQYLRECRTYISSVEDAGDFQGIIVRVGLFSPFHFVSARRSFPRTCWQRRLSPLLSILRRVSDC